jgi:DNA polymerase III gamma/tau subunit
MIEQFSLKHRPRTWEDVFGQDNIVKALRKRITENNFPKATLFVGPFGTGKTTMAEMLACCMQSALEDGNPNWDSPAGRSIASGNFDRDTQRLDGSQLLSLIWIG